MFLNTIASFSCLGSSKFNFENLFLFTKNPSYKIRTKKLVLNVLENVMFYLPSQKNPPLINNHLIVIYLKEPFLKFGMQFLGKFFKKFHQASQKSVKFSKKTRRLHLNCGRESQRKSLFVSIKIKKTKHFSKTHFDVEYSQSMWPVTLQSCRVTQSMIIQCWLVLIQQTFQLFLRKNLS